MVQKKVTDNFPARRATPRAAEKRKLSKSVKNLNFDDDEPISSRIPKLDENSLESFRKALDTSSPINLPGREKQIAEINDFLSTHLYEKTPGSLYISGAPGTGKTAVVQFVVDQITAAGQINNKKVKFFQVFINCMCKKSATEIYELVMEKLKISRTRKTGSLKDNVVNRIFTKSKTAQMIVIILDEMDQIMKGTNEVLYSLFEWARSPDSKLILIGIANALDLTVRHLPFLHLNSSPVKQLRNASAPVLNQCKTISFPPYQRDDIEKIIQERMESVGHSIFNSDAIKLVAAKVAATTGDARKALHVCKEAMVSVEKQVQRDMDVTDENYSGSLFSPKKMCIRNDQIGIIAVSKALQVKKDDGPLPIQQTTILAALLRIHREAPNTKEPLIDGLNKPIPITSLYKEYRKICTLKGFSWIEESELPSTCEILQDRTLLSIVNTGNATGKKLSVGTKKFGSPAATRCKLGVTFDPRAVEGLIFQGDLKALFS